MKIGDVRKFRVPASRAVDAMIKFHGTSLGLK